MAFIPGHPIILDLRPGHFGGTTASFGSPNNGEAEESGKKLHPAPLQRTHRGAPWFGRRILPIQVRERGVGVFCLGW